MPASIIPSARPDIYQHPTKIFFRLTRLIAESASGHPTVQLITDLEVLSNSIEYHRIYHEFHFSRNIIMS
jgi:hypothetical protein